MKSNKGGWTRIPILDRTTSTLLRTSTVISQGETLVLFNPTDGQKRSTVGNVSVITTGIAGLITSSEIMTLMDIAIDTIGNIFVCGYLSNNDGFYIAKINNYEVIRQRVLFTGDRFADIGAIAVDSEGNVYLCGQLKGYLYLAKFDNDLNDIIQYRINGGSWLCGLTDIALDDDGNLLVCGTVYNNINIVPYVAKFDKMLKPIAQYKIVGIDGSGDVRGGIAVDGNGNIFTCGQIGTQAGIFKFTSDLSLVAQYVVDAEHSDFRSLAVDSSNNVFTCGWRYDGANNVQLKYIVKFDNNLNIISEKTTDDTTQSNGFTGVMVTSDDNVFVVGSLRDSDDQHPHCYIGKFDNDLNLIASYQIKSQEDSVEQFHNIILGAEDNLFCCGTIFDRGCIFNFDINISSLPSILSIGPWSITITDLSESTTSQSWTFTSQSFSREVYQYSPISSTISFEDRFWEVFFDDGSIYEADISSFSLTEPPTIVWKEFDRAVWVSTIRQQEAFEPDWKRFDVSVLERPLTLTVLPKSTNIELVTADDIVTEESIILYNAEDGFKEGQVGEVTKHGDKWDVKGLQYYKDIRISDITDDLNIRPGSSLDLSFDGLKLFIAEISTRTVYQFDLSVPWDISSITYNGICSKLDDANDPKGIRFSQDGTKLYVLDHLPNRIIQYNLSRPWDILTKTYSSEFTIDDIESNVGGLAFSSDGKYVYVVNYNDSKIHQYELSTLWNISTATLVQSVQIDLPSGFLASGYPEGVYFSDDGIYMYIIDLCNIYQYRLSTPWDISTATYFAEEYMGRFGGDLIEIVVAPSGTFSYFLGYSSLTDSKGHILQTVFGFYRVDISSFSLSKPPVMAWKQPVKTYVCVESSPDRCVWRDEDISNKIQNATTNYFEFKDARLNLLVNGDQLVVNGQTTTVDNVVITDEWITSLIERTSVCMLKAISVDSYGNIFVCGYEYYNNGSNRRPYIAKLDKQLNLLAEYVIDVDIGELGSIIVDSNDTVIVCGRIEDHPYIARFDNDLRLISQYVLAGQCDTGWFSGIAISSNFIYACGCINNRPCIAEFNDDLLLTTSPVIVDTGRNSSFAGVATDTSSNIVVCGSYYDGSIWKGYIAKFDSDLNLVSQSIIDSDNSSSLSDIAVDSSNNIFVCGHAYDNDRYNGYVAKFGSDLSLVSQYTIDAGRTSDFYGIVVDTADNVYVCGHVYVNPDSIYVAKFNNDLNVTAQYSVVNQLSKGSGSYKIIADSENSIFVCGHCTRRYYIGVFSSDMAPPDSLVVGSDVFINKPQSWSMTPRTWTTTSQTWTTSTKDCDQVSHSWPLIEQESTISSGYIMIYGITVPDQGSTITSVIIPSRATLQTVSDRFLSADRSYFISKYQPTEKTGRSLLVKIEGYRGTDVAAIYVNTWTS